MCRSKLPDYYLAGGVITQTIWKHLLDRPLLDQVKDLDAIYFAAETRNKQLDQEQTLNRYSSHNYPIDLKNQALVHQWYENKFGLTVDPYQRVEQGIDTWLPALAVGIRKIDQDYQLYAPFGLDDLFNKQVRPNKRAMSKQNYLKMTASFKQRWPQIKVHDWDNERG